MIFIFFFILFTISHAATDVSIYYQQHARIKCNETVRGNQTIWVMEKMSILPTDDGIPFRRCINYFEGIVLFFNGSGIEYQSIDNTNDFISFVFTDVVINGDVRIDNSNEEDFIEISINKSMIQNSVWNMNRANLIRIEQSVIKNAELTFYQSDSITLNSNHFHHANVSISDDVSEMFHMLNIENTKSEHSSLSVKCNNMVIISDDYQSFQHHNIEKRPGCTFSSN